MKSVMQTVFGFKNGDCMRACVASIFELPIEEVPNFNEPDQSHFERKLDAWGTSVGLTVVDISVENDDTKVLLKDCWLIACGRSPRGKTKNNRHAVVWRNGRMVHDPHPDQRGIRGNPETYTIFIVTDPSKYRKRL